MSSSSLLRVTEEAGRVTVSFPAGTSIVETNVEAFGRDLAAVARGRENLPLTVDLAGIDMLTSTALAKLLTLNNQLKAAGGRLTLTNPKPLVRQTIVVAKLDTVLEIA